MKSDQPLMTRDVIGPDGAAALLSVQGMRVAYPRTGGGSTLVTWDVDLSLRAGEILGLTGESGCGKSTIALTSIGYRPNGARILGGSAVIDETDLVSLPTRTLRRFWGPRVAYVPQDATSGLNPSLTVGAQLAEPLMTHTSLRGQALLTRQIELLEMVHLPDPHAALRRYPHQLSGGQQQRILIAMALSCQPSVLVLDEPTTGLDVTTQATVTRLIRKLVTETKVAALFVSHNLAVLAGIADRLAVMYAGEVVEEGVCEAIVHEPSHPYTRALIAALPSVHKPHRLVGIPGRPPARVSLQACSFMDRCPYAIAECRQKIPLVELHPGRKVRCIRVDSLEPSLRIQPLALQTTTTRLGALLEVQNLWCRYAKASSPAVKDISFEVAPGEMLGVVGESGSGKSTLLRALVGLVPPVAGRIRFLGADQPGKAADRQQAVRQAIQLVFQNPDSSLNPRQTVQQLLMRPIALFRSDLKGGARLEAITELIASVKLPKSALHSYPSQLSGGQRQRVALARAFAARPKLLLCDEVTSFLDVSVQATIVDLISDLAVKFETAVIVVTHDFGVVRALASRVVVMKDGEACEQGDTDQVLRDPKHAYTRRLIESIPDLAG